MLTSVFTVACGGGSGSDGESPKSPAPELAESKVSLVHTSEGEQKCSVIKAEPKDFQIECDSEILKQSVNVDGFQTSGKNIGIDGITVNGITIEKIATTANGNILTGSVEHKDFEIELTLDDGSTVGVKFP